MYFIKLNILLLALVVISTNLVFATVPDNCLNTLDLESKNLSEEETMRAADCFLNELVKRGVKLCDSQCLEKLTPKQLEQHFINRARQTREIIDEELARRVKEKERINNEAIDVGNNCLETIQLNPGEGMTYEDTANFVSCIMHEFHKRGIKDCDEKCLEKLSEEEKDKYHAESAKAFEEIIEGERARRALQSLKPSAPRVF